MGTAPASRMLSSEKTRLQTSKLNHKTQQRSDDLFARENQHIAQRPRPKMGDKQFGNLRGFRNRWHVRRVPLGYFGNKCPLFGEKSESGENYCPNTCEPTLREYDE
jgi:hypothetical protein